MGITSEMLPKIFELFTQGPRSRHLARGGSGIGLAVVKQWADAMGGTVEVRSEGPGLGSDFTVRLPLKRPAGWQAAAAPDGGSPARHASTRACTHYVGRGDPWPGQALAARWTGQPRWLRGCGAA